MSTKTDNAPHELAEVMRSFSNISESLLESYRALAARAERVEGELVQTNALLAGKVAELDATRADLEAILHALPSGVVVRDRDGTIVRVNAAAAAILEIDVDALIGRNAHPLLAGSRANGVEREILRDNGERLVLASRCSRVAGERGGSVEILDDRTQIARLNERLHGLDKMAALGTIAGGVAHEIRNPLNAIGGFAKLLTRELPQGSKEHRFATRIFEGVEEADAIISNMLSFADPERLVLEAVDACELAQSAIKAALEALPEGAQREGWRVSSSVDAPPFQADRIKLRQVLRNLVANALQAQPQGGAVHVDIALDAPNIVMRVVDAGPGIPSHLRARVTDPFFTTRAQGTGLGLALVHTIAGLHGGRFEVSPDSAPSTFEGQAWTGAHMVFCIPFTPA